MAAEDFKRKLTAVMSADVAGYSRLMAEDEAATVKTIATYREVMASLIKQHRGRVVDSPGDNVLAEFSSVVDAVQCAVAVQKEFQARNVELPENRRMEFRIGINLGDVIEEEDRLYGDGVNIAARLESLADPGGICVSKTAFDQIETKLPLGYEYLGEQEVKNIPKPVGAYRVLMEPRVTVAEEIQKVKAVPLWQRRTILAAGVVLVLVVFAALIWNFYLRRPPMEVASLDKMAFPLPDKPSIAVLPFVNMSEDPKQEYFSDGLTEEIITALSKVPKLFVIARNSTFSYKGKSVKVNQVSEELGVRYVLEGSVRKAGERVRITAQLIDALNGHHLWAERYDRGLKDIFALQDEITKKIVTALNVKLSAGEQASLDAKGTENLEAYLKYLQGQEHWRKNTPDDNVRARQLAEEVIALDPSYARGYLLLGRVTVFDVPLGLSKSPKESTKEAFKLAQKVISMDDSDSGGHRLLGGVYILMRQHEKSIAARERAVALNPNHAENFDTLGRSLTYAGRPQEAIPLHKKAMRLNPHYPPMYLVSLGRAYWLTGRYDEALEESKKLLDRSLRGEFNLVLAHLQMAMIYIALGREAEARAHVEEMLGIDPNYSLEQFRKITVFYKDPDARKRMLEALRKAGVPEHPPLPLPDKPSIAVLPFVNMSDDPKQEYFVDGMTEDLITDLSKISGLFVIARNSVFRYKGKVVDLKKVSRELGVRHVLEGTVRKAGGRVRITAQLIDTTTAGHIWAERYDGKIDDVFALQDEITGKIVKALAVQLTASEQEQVTKKETESITAYDSFLKARVHYLRHTPEDFAKALFHFENTIEIDPNYRRAYFFMALIYSKASKLGRRWLDALDLRNAQVADGQAKKYLELSKSKIVFVTSARYTGNLGGVAGADAKCQQLAEAAGLPGTYKAWLSDKTSSPAATFARWNGPYVLVDGTEIASNWLGLTFDFHFVPIKITETGQDIGESFQWTNTSKSGGPGPCPCAARGDEYEGLRRVRQWEVRDGSCQNWTSSNGDLHDGLYGNSIVVGIGWTYTYSELRIWAVDCDEMLRLYCFQQ